MGRQNTKRHSTSMRESIAHAQRRIAVASTQCTTPQKASSPFNHVIARHIHACHNFPQIFKHLQSRRTTIAYRIVAYLFKERRPAHEDFPQTGYDVGFEEVGVQYRIGPEE